MFPPNCSYINITSRPGGVNHKGVVDFWRRPKPAYQLVAAKYNATSKQR
jgi:beta-glucuronidase